ncbi:hypothetical protein BRADI_1g30462v3 [Brachypodium distachyon]|uniref:F-box domain-containing protein n=1 Tax=Brachypodium distachyon TaxID=15368 RepID=A0A0Q3RUU9_BRADI|nr:hypothetical protein BRADI_1g30462v3 [Brachypodium distachyon]
MEYSLGQRQCSLLAPGDGEPDRISALPDDLLLTILARLGCTSTAACTSVLSRRWSSLWTRLREVILHGVALQPLESVLNHVSPAVSLLEIHVPEDYSPDPAPVSSLLHAAVRLAPEELVLTLPARLVKIDLPRFHRATSITLTSRFLILRVPAAAAGEYCPMLETLSLSGGLIGNLDALLSRCPRLRVLRLVAPNIMIDDKDPMVVHSETLQELFMEAKTKEACEADCPCEPTNWKTQTICLTALEEVEIDGFEGEGHELDFLKLILRCVPNLRRLVLKLPDDVFSLGKDACNGLFKTLSGAYSPMECHIYLGSGQVCCACIISMLPRCNRDIHDCVCM